MRGAEVVVLIGAVVAYDFFPPVDSPLSLLLFTFTDKSMLFFLFFILFEDNGERVASVFVGSIEVSLAVVDFVIVMGSVAFVTFIDVDFATASVGCVVSFIGVLSPFTRYLGPPLFFVGWSPVSGFLFSFVDVASASATTAILVVVDVFLLVFLGQDRAKSPSCFQAQHRGLLPSTTTIIV